MLAALGFAAYENPEVQRWIDEQRRKLADLLRGIGEELDPQSRREAEAFVYQGQSLSPKLDPEPQPTASTSGASIPNAAVRRVPVQGRMSDADTEERQRLGREYLAARNQLLRVMRQRRDGASNVVVAEQVTEIKSEPQTSGKQSSDTTRDSKNATSEQPINNQDVSIEQRREAPPLPPKVKLEEVEPTPWHDAVSEQELQTMPGSFDPPQPEMTYEEQLERAISLSKQESTAAADAYDDEVRRAVEASLRDFSNHITLREAVSEVDQTTVDLLGDDLPRANVWSQEDDLYTITPNLTRASLAAWNQQPLQPIAQNPFEDSSLDDMSNATSWTLEGETQKKAEPANPGVIQADDSDEDSNHVVTPDSWTEVGSLSGEDETGQQLA